jgi:single-strand DNA-binding protein
MFNKIILIGRLGQNAEARRPRTTASSSPSTSLHRKAGNDKGDYENRTEWHRVFAWSNLSKFAKTLQKGQLIALEGILRYREYEEDVHGLTIRHRIAEIHARRAQIAGITG